MTMYCLYIAVKSEASVSKEIISLFAAKYRLPVIHSSLISIRIYPISMSNDASQWECPDHFTKAFEFQCDSFQEIGSTDFFPEHRRIGTAVH